MSILELLALQNLKVSNLNSYQEEGDMSINDKVIDYSQLVDEAMYFIVYKALKIVEQHGLIGDHHFMISFLTKHPGVMISEGLRNQYPNEMMIVLQYQFRGLAVHRGYFEVILSFGGVPEKIVVPFAAVTTFADPSVQFCLEFSAQTGFDQTLYPTFKANNGVENEDDINVALAVQHLHYPDDNKVPHSNLSVNNNGGNMDNVVSLDEFRRKRNKK